MSFLSAANVFSFYFVSVKKIKAEILVFINRVRPFWSPTGYTIRVLVIPFVKNANINF
jgi:hypothetical protein